MIRSMRAVPVAALLLGLVGRVTEVRGQAAEADGFVWATIGALGNAPYVGAGPLTRNRGSVGYVYRIAKLEVNTAQWMDFANAVGPLGETFRIGDGPIGGFERDTSYAGPGKRYRLRAIPNAAMQPVRGISWQNAARYCNWLHNGRTGSLASLVTGAYDTTTFGIDPGSGGRTDALTHLPGARYWIPTLDEWMKAAHYDPQRLGADQGGWWLFPTSSDTAPIPGAPGSGGQTGAGWAGAAVAQIPLGAYPGVTSPWGLLDTSGGASEWTENVDDPSDRAYRIYDGASMFDQILSPQALDSITGVGTLFPDQELSFVGLRVASSVPDSSVGGRVLCGLLLIHARRRRHGPSEVRLRNDDRTGACAGGARRNRR